MRQSFEQFYHKKHNGRKLQWVPSQGTADVRARFKSGVKELNVSTFGMAVLLQFNDLPAGTFYTFSVRLW